MVKQEREKRRWSQHKLAEFAGVSQGFIQKIENGLKVPSLATSIAIADAFDISLDDLCGRVK